MSRSSWYSCLTCPYGTGNIVEAATHERETGHSIRVTHNEIFDMYETRYMEIQNVLNIALGPNDEDGAGQGVVQDVALVVRQRDEALASLLRHDRQDVERIRAIREP